MMKRTLDAVGRTAFVGALLMAATIVLSGCASTAAKPAAELGGKIVDGKTARWTANSDECIGYYGAYTRQGEDLMVVEGTNVSFKITGATRIALRGFKPTPAAPAADPSTLGTALNAVERIAGFATMGYVGGKIAGREAPRPEVVRQEVLVPMEGVAAP